MIALWNGMPGSGRGREPMASTTFAALMVSDAPCGVLSCVLMRSTSFCPGEGVRRMARCCMPVGSCGSPSAAVARNTVTPRRASREERPVVMVETMCSRHWCRAGSLF